MKLAKLGLIKNVLWKEIKLDYCLKFVLFKIRQIELRSVLLSFFRTTNRKLPDVVDETFEQLVYDRQVLNRGRDG